MWYDNTGIIDRGLGYQPRRRPKGAGPNVPKILGPPTYDQMVWPTATKFGLITYVGTGVFLGH